MEKAAYRDVLERLDAVFPDRDILTIGEVAAYMHQDRRTLLADRAFPVIEKQRRKGATVHVHKAALARYLA